jgi:solute carrier family 25 (adenine nucleotide translocator) protein 4/5/6/31
VKDFFRGNMAYFSRYFPLQAMRFGLKDYYRKMFGAFRQATKEETKWMLMNNFTSGALAGASATMLVYPLDMARSRVCHNTSFQNFRDVYSWVSQNEGMRGIYRGMGISLMGSMLYRSIYFGGYDSAKTLAYDDFEKTGVVDKMKLAYGITVAAGLATYPLDTLRRRVAL